MTRLSRDVCTFAGMLIYTYRTRKPYPSGAARIFWHRDAGFATHRSPQ